MTIRLLGRRQAVLSGLVLLVAAPPARAHNGTVHVVVDKLTFLPAEIEVRVGETIEWTNKDPFAHTATVKDGWEVPIPSGEKATHRVTSVDNVEYYCRFHPNMKGRISIVT